MFCVAHVAFTHTEFISASCWIFISMAKDIEQDLNAIGEIGKSKTDRMEFLSRLSKLIEIHSQAKELSEISILFHFNFSHTSSISSNQIRSEVFGLISDHDIGFLCLEQRKYMRSDVDTPNGNS